MELLIKGGTLVTPTETFQADLRVIGETIAEIGLDLPVGGATVIDASGKYVLPGMIDVHTHLALRVAGTVSSDDFRTGTRAAAFGGITTIIDFTAGTKGETLAEGIRKRRQDADGNVCIDYALHLCATEATPDLLAEIPEAIRAGNPSFKLFTAYDAMMLDDGALLEILSAVGKAGGLAGVHAENYPVIKTLTRRLLADGKTGPEYHPVSRPDYCEGEATERVITLAEAAGAPLYVFHLTCARALEQVAVARGRGLSVYAETCMQYLLLTDARYQEPDFGGAKYVLSPPLRKASDNAALWEGLRRGDLQVVASDHCPFTLAQKDAGRGDFTKIPNGAPGLETTLPLLHSEGVKKGRISLNRMVEVFSANPARIFGLRKKGALAPGFDADLVVFDPDKEVTLSAGTLHMNCDYNPYEGVRVTGYPVVTVSRGHIVCQNGEFRGDFAHGRMVERGAVGR